jgi:hypothetical protein
VSDNNMEQRISTKFCVRIGKLLTSLKLDCTNFTSNPDSTVIFSLCVFLLIVVVLCILLSFYMYLSYLMCICFILCVFVVLCVYCCSYFRCRTAG